MTDFTMFAGTNRDIVIEVYELDGITPADLTDADVVWVCATTANPHVVKFKKMSTVGVAEIELMVNPSDSRVDPPNSVIWVHLIPDNTDELLGEFRHEARVEIGDIEEVVYASTFQVTDSITYNEWA